MSRATPFQALIFVWDDSPELEAVTATCNLCSEERSLAFAHVIGGIALMCPICRSRDLVEDGLVVTQHIGAPSANDP